MSYLEINAALTLKPNTPLKKRVFLKKNETSLKNTLSPGSSHQIVLYF